MVECWVIAKLAHRLGCAEGHVICYECLYRVYLSKNPPDRCCFKCRELLGRTPHLDRTLKVLAESILPAHIPSKDDVCTAAPEDATWINEMTWPPTVSNARKVLGKIACRQPVRITVEECDDVISIASGDSVILIDD